MDLLFLIIGLLAGFFTGWLFRLRKSTSAIPFEAGIPIDQFHKLQQEFARIEARYEQVLSEKSKTDAELLNERERAILQGNRLAKAEEAFRQQDERAKLQKTEIEELQVRFKTEFENIATKLLEEKSKKFTEQNKVNIDGILTPLKDRIREFEEKVDKVYKAESNERVALKTEIRMLHDLNQQISKEANNLARALKGDTKKQGNWGEIILEKILERSGLIKDQEYKIQMSFTQEDGKRQQPDVIICLPEEKHLVIDAKVSLVAYEALVNAEDEETRESALKDHIISLKNHIRLLSEKNYQMLPGINTPDFVLLFMPIESSFGIAMQFDHELFTYAWDRRIVIVSPSTLLATLRTVSSIWKQDKQTRFALEIAEESGRMYDKFVSFLDDLQRVGKAVENTQKSYDDAIKKLSNGNGNLISKAEKIRKLGAKNSKSVPVNMLASGDEAE